MVCDRKFELTRALDPIVGGNPWVDEKERRIGDAISFQADLCREDRALRRLLVDRAKGHG